jgi:HEAT repeat protein
MLGDHSAFASEVEPVATSAEIATVVRQRIAELAATRTEIRQQAADALGRIGRAAIPMLVLAAADPNPQLQQAAKRSLAAVDANWARSKEAESVVTNLIGRLGGRTSAAACDMLTLIGAGAVPGLTAALGQPDSEGNRHAEGIRTLGHIGGPATEAVAAIADLLRTGPRHVQRAAAVAISRIGPSAASAVPALLEALGSADRDVRFCATQALRKFSDDHPDSLPLVQLLGDRDDEVREAAVETLRAFGTAALPSLIATLMSRDAWRQMEKWKEIAEAITNCEPRNRMGFQDRKEFVVPPSRFYQIEECEWVASQRLQGAVSVIGELGPAATDAIPVVTELLEERDPCVRAAAATALRKIGVGAIAAVTALVRLLADEREAPRTAALEALNKIAPEWYAHPDHATAVESILVLLDQGPEHTKSLEQSLARMGPGFVPKIAVRLSFPSRQVREASCRVLGRMGAAASVAVPALQQVAANPNENRFVRDAAHEALLAIAKQETQQATGTS